MPPPQVSPVLEAAKGGDYELAHLPRNVREGTTSRLARFVSSMARQGHAGKQRVAKRADAGHHFGAAASVAYGYKAPVSMLLVPFFVEAYAKEGFKFLQVFILVLKKALHIATCFLCSGLARTCAQALLFCTHSPCGRSLFLLQVYPHARALRYRWCGTAGTLASAATSRP